MISLDKFPDALLAPVHGLNVWAVDRSHTTVVTDPLGWIPLPPGCGVAPLRLLPWGSVGVAYLIHKGNCYSNSTGTVQQQQQGLLHINRGFIVPNPKFSNKLYFQLFFESPCINNSNDLRVDQICMLEDFPEEGERSYTDRQTKHDREYAAAWENAPLEFKKSAALMGLHPDVPENEGMAMEYDDNYASSAHMPNMAKAIDDFVDRIVEELSAIYNWTMEQRDFYSIIIKFAVEWVQKPMQQELEHSQANLLNRVAAFLIADEKGNLRARVHAMVHSIPRMATENGFPSMRASAKSCGVSPEWLRRKRDSCCDLFSIKRPANGTKSDEAKIKYRINALGNHWRNQRYKAPHHEKQQQSGNSIGAHKQLCAN